MTPEDLLFSKDHEWLRIVGETGTIGITDHAQKELGEVVYVELPKVGDTFDAGQTFGSVESVKAVSELFIPVSSEIVEVNPALADSPEKINEDPYGQGWMFRVRSSTRRTRPIRLRSRRARCRRSSSFRPTLPS